MTDLRDGVDQAERRTIPVGEAIEFALLVCMWVFAFIGATFRFGLSGGFIALAVSAFATLVLLAVP